jgi:hypothetical protein
MIDEIGLRPLVEVHDGVFVYVGDELIGRERWDDVRLVRGTVVSVGVTPGQTGGGKDPTRTVAMIAVMVVAMVATYGIAAYGIPGVVAAGTTGASMMGAVAGAAVSLSGTMLVNSLIPLPQLKNDQPQGKNYLSGMQNRMDPHGPVTRVLGRNRVFPKYAAVPYTELVSSDDQYLRCLFLIGKGKYALSDYKIGDTPLANFQGVELEQYFTGDSTHYALFPNDTAEQALSVELLQNVWNTRTTAVGTQQIAVEFTFPEGLFQIGSTGRRRAASVAFEVEYSPAGLSQWKSVTETRWRISFANPWISDSVAAGMTITSATGSGTVGYAHHNSQAVMTGAQEGVSTWENLYFVDYVDIDLASGSFSPGQTVTIGGAHQGTAATVAHLPYTIDKEHRDPAREGLVWSVPSGQYDVRVRRLTADGAADTWDASYWTCLRSTTFATPVNLTGCTLVGLRMKASGQLNGVLQNFNCLAESLLNVWTGTQWVLSKTRNPAWAGVEVLCGTSNLRPVSTAKLDLAAWKGFADRCEAAGFNFDAVIDYRTTVWELLRQICAAGRAAPGLVDNRYTVIEDLVRTAPVQQFGPRNSWGFKGSRVFPDVPHALRIRFPNEAKSYEEDHCVVYDDGYNEGNATLYETLELFGITNYNHLWKLGRYYLAVMRLRPETYEFVADPEHFVCTRGDLVRLTHDVLMVGLGSMRIKSVSTTQITVDDVCQMEAGKSYGFQFRRADGSFTTATVTTVAGEPTTLAFSPAMNPVDLPTAGDLCFFGETGKISIDCLVSRIKPGPDLTARLTCVPYNPAILTADSGAIPAWESNITLPPVINRTPPVPKIISAVYVYHPVSQADDGMLELFMQVGFDAQQTAYVATSVGLNETPPDVIAGFQAQFREDDGNWIEVPAMGASARSFEFPAQNDVTYDIRIRSFSAIGTVSDWYELSNVATNYVPDKPADVTGLQAVGGGTSFTGFDLEVEWTPVAAGGAAGILLRDYVVEVRTADGNTLLRTEYPTQARYTYDFDKNLVDGGPRPSVQIKVKARNRQLAVSETAASAVFTNPVPSNPSGLGARAFMGGVEFYWTAAAGMVDAARVDRADTARLTRDGTARKTRDTAEGVGTLSDLSHYQYRIKVGSGTWGAWQRTMTNVVSFIISQEQKELYGADATIYFEVVCVDVFNQESGATAIDRAVGSLNIAATDIADFAVNASKLFTRIPIPEGLALSNNSPSTGYISWSSFIIYYNGAGYTIPGGSTANRFVYWKDLGSTLSSMDAHPPSALSDWRPQEDFIIAVNIGGVAQEAWNAIANQVIGSAYIMTAAINDLHVSDISGVKISATTQIAIGSRTFGAAGIQLEYNAGSPRFYAGNGALDYVLFNGSQMELSTSKANALVLRNGGGMLIESGGDLTVSGGGSITVNSGGNLHIAGGGGITVNYGGDIGLYSAAGNPSRLNFYDPNALRAVELLSAAALYFNVRPSANQTKSIFIGESSYLWRRIYLNSYYSVYAGAEYNSNIVGLLVSAETSTPTMSISLTHSSAGWRAFYFSVVSISGSYVGALTNHAHKANDLGSDSLAMRNVWSDEFQNVADLYHLDDRDDLAEIAKIKSSGVIHPQTGLEIIDDDTVPEWMLTKGTDQRRALTEDGKPYISSRVLLSLLMGACRQLDAKIATLSKEKGAA